MKLTKEEIVSNHGNQESLFSLMIGKIIWRLKQPITTLTAVINATFEESSNTTIIWKDKKVNVKTYSNQIEVQGDLPIDDLKSLINKLVTSLAFDNDEFYEVIEFKY